MDLDLCIAAQHGLTNMLIPTDREFRSWSKETQYRYLERLGMLVADEEVELGSEVELIAREEAREWERYENMELL